MENVYDVLVAGGGPAGYTAAMYAARAGLRVVLLERALAGGQMTLTDQIENYPGFPSGIDGFSLGEQMRLGASGAGAECVMAEILDMRLSDPVKSVRTAKQEYRARTVILAMGAYARRLGVEGEERLIGRGVSYCAHCDGRFFKGKRVAVIGGGESAVAEAVFLSRLASHVFLIHRRDTLRAGAVAREALAACSNVSVLWSSTPAALLGEERLSGITVSDIRNNTTQELAVDGMFVSIGRVPETALVQGQIDLDEGGYILAGEDCHTSCAGVFVAGDIRRKPLRQIVTAVSDGAVAAAAAEQFLSHV